jgi:hypothetical protein
MQVPARTPRLLAGFVAAVLVGGAQPAAACTGNGYGYAGLIGADATRGVRATISALSVRVGGGHAAGWVGVGGSAAGPNGEDEWMQIGLAAYEETGVRLYYEVVRGTVRDYVEIDTDVPLREAHRVAVLEVRGAPGWWRAWADGRPVTDPIYLAGSHRAWQPVVTSESWSASCRVNAFRFRFRRVEVRKEASWRRMPAPFVFADPSFRVIRWSRGFDALTRGA